MVRGYPRHGRPNRPSVGVAEMAKVVQVSAYGRGVKRGAMVVNRPAAQSVERCPMEGCGERTGHDLGRHDVQLYTLWLAQRRESQ